MRFARTFLTVAASVALVATSSACGGGPATSPPPHAGQHATTSAVRSPSTADSQYFVEAMRTGTSMHGDPASVLGTGLQACAFLDQGMTPERVRQALLATMTRLGGTAHDAQAVVGAAIVDLCPRHSGEIAMWENP